MKIVGTKDIENGLLSPKGSLQEMVLPESLQTERFRLKTGDVVMTARGTIKISAVNDDQSGCFAGPNLIVIRPGTQLHSALLLAFLRHPKTQDEIKRRSVGTTVQAINLDSILSLKIVVPPQTDQPTLASIVQLAERQYSVGQKILDLRRSLAQELAMKALAV